MMGWSRGQSDTAIIGVHPSQFGARAAKIRADLRGVKPVPKYTQPPIEAVLIEELVAPPPSRQMPRHSLFTAPIEVIGGGIRVADIQAAIILAFKVSRADFFSHRREGPIVAARQIAMALCKHLTERTSPDLGRRFGGRDHTTVLHAVNKYRPLIEAVIPSMSETSTVDEWATALRALAPEFSKRKKGTKGQGNSREKWWLENRDIANFARRRKIPIVEARKLMGIAS